MVDSTRVAGLRIPWAVNVSRRVVCTNRARDDFQTAGRSLALCIASSRDDSQRVCRRMLFGSTTNQAVRQAVSSSDAEAVRLADTVAGWPVSQDAFLVACAVAGLLTHVALR